MAEETQERILDIKVRYDDAIKKISQYMSAIESVKQNEKDLKKQRDNGIISQEDYNKAIAAGKIKSQEYSEAIRVINREVQNNLKVEKQQEGSLVSLRARLSNLTRQYDELSASERNAAKGKELLNHINEVTDELKGAEEESQRFYRNVGNYDEAFSNAVVSGNSFIGNLKKMSEGTGGVVGGLKSMTSAAMKFIMTPIGAVVTALALIFKGLSLGISSSEENTAKFNQILAPFKVIMDALLNVLQTVVGWWLDWVGVILDAYSAIGKFFAGLVGMTEQYDKMNDKIQEGIKLEKEKLQLSKDTRKANEDNKTVELEVSELRNKAAQKDKYSHKERIAFLDEAIKKETSVAEARKQLAERNLAIMEAEAARAGNTEETEKKLSEARIAVTQATIDLNNKTRELTAQRVEAVNAMKAETKAEQDKAKEKAKAASEAAKEAKRKELEEVRKGEDEMLKLVKSYRARQSQEINYEYNRQIEDLRNKLNTEKNLTVKARKAINTQITALEKQKENELSKLSNEILKRDIKERQRLISLQLETVKHGGEQEYQLKMQQLISQRDAELSEIELTEQMKVAIREKYDKQMDDLVTKRNADVLAKQREAIRVRYETEIAQAYGNEEEILRIRMEQKKAELDSIQQMEGESLEAFNLRKIELGNEYLDAKQALTDKEVAMEQIKYQAMEDITSGLINLTEALGESEEGLTKLSKVLALAEIAINTGKAISSGVASAAKEPFPANLAAIATTVATVLSNITTAIKSVKSAKFATGGIVTGPGTETSDSIPALLSDGESVLTAKATQMFAPLLSSFNMMGGGVPINVTASGNQAIGEDMLARAVAKGMMMAPPPVVSVEEFTSVSNKVKLLEQNGNL